MNKRAIIMVVGTSLLFLVTVIYLLSAKGSLQQKATGADAFQVLEDTRTAQKITSYVRQSLRNAAYGALADLHQEGSFPKIVNNKACPFLQGKPLLFSEDSCSYTRSAFEQHYTSLLQKRLASFFSSPLYGSQLSAQDFPFTLMFEQGFMTLTGTAPRPFTFAGKKITYDFSVSYRERIAYDFRHYDLLLKTFQDNIGCIQRFTEQHTALHGNAFGQELLRFCSFSDAFHWQFDQQGDVVFVTATTKEPVLFLDNLSFAFAITLNKLSLPLQDITLS